MDRTMEFIGHSWFWNNGEKVYQEDQLIPGTVLPIGHTDFGKPWAFKASEIHLESCSDGIWVMDRLGSYHRHPFKTERAARAYLEVVQGKAKGGK